MFEEKEILAILDLIGFAFSESCFSDKGEMILNKIKTEYKDNEVIQEAIKDIEDWN